VNRRAHLFSFDTLTLGRDLLRLDRPDHVRTAFIEPFGIKPHSNEASRSILQRNLRLSKRWSHSKEHQMADNKNPNEKQPGEKPEGKYHYNPGNQSGKTTEDVVKEKAKKHDDPLHDRP
jgi:hypothetical protein